MTVAIDHRCLVRLWTLKKFDLITQQRTAEGQRPIDVVKSLLAKSQLSEAVATADWSDGSRWSGFVYYDSKHQLAVVHHDEMKKLLEWPQYDNLGPNPS